MTCQGLDKFPDLHDVVEDGETFQENALKKAREMSLATGLPAIADDSGLCVDALNGDPGIFSARWAGSHGDDQANTAKVLTQLRDVPDEKRSAHFTCVAALYLPDGRSHSEEAHFEGWILRAPIGEQGFGYDPIFLPDLPPIKLPARPPATPPKDFPIIFPNNPTYIYIITIRK